MSSESEITSLLLLHQRLDREDHGMGMRHTIVSSLVARQTQSLRRRRLVRLVFW